MTVAQAPQAHLPSLPQVLDRKALDDALESAANATRASGHPLAVITLDVDNFRAYADAVGTKPAEQVLTQLALLLGQLKPVGASLASFGSDEFVLVLPNMMLSAAAALAERLRQHCDEALARLAHQPSLTVTLGVAASPPDADWQAQALFALADARMSFAKKRLHPHHDLVYAGPLPSDWHARLDIDPTRWPSL